VRIAQRVGFQRGAPEIADVRMQIFAQNFIREARASHGLVKLVDCVEDVVRKCVGEVGLLHILHILDRCLAKVGFDQLGPFALRRVECLMNRLTELQDRGERAVNRRILDFSKLGGGREGMCGALDQTA
jgi:hypothetical protein